MTVNKATKAARARHAQGIRVLDRLFGISAAQKRLLELRRIFLTPIRAKPNTPPVRTAAQKRRRHLRRIVRDSRRRNR